MKFKLKFYMTLFSNNNILNDKEYDCSGSLSAVESYYLVMCKGELWLGQVTQVKSGQIVMAKCLEKVDAPKGSTGKWPVMNMITQSVMSNRK